MIIILALGFSVITAEAIEIIPFVMLVGVSLSMLFVPQ